MRQPGWWNRAKSNLDRYRDHLACLQFSFCNFWKYSKFL
jgi:hypothetical protein